MKNKRAELTENAIVIRVSCYAAEQLAEITQK